MKTDNKKQKQYALEIFTPEVLRLYAEDKLCDQARLDVEALVKSDDRAALYLAEIEQRLVGGRAAKGQVAAMRKPASPLFARYRPKRSGRK